MLTDPFSPMLKLKRLDTVQERRQTLEASFRLPKLNSIDSISIPFMLQVTYTDTKLSHRFVRFEVPFGSDGH